MSNRYALEYTAWKSARWWLAPLLLMIIVVLPGLVTLNPFRMPPLKALAHTDGKWTLQRRESGKYFFLHDGRLYRTNCMGASTDLVFKEDCDSILPFLGQQLEANLSEGRLLVLRERQPIFQVEAIEGAH